MDAGRIWLRVRRGWSQWKGLVGDGALRPAGTGIFILHFCIFNYLLAYYESLATDPVKVSVFIFVKTW